MVTLPQYNALMFDHLSPFHLFLTFDAKGHRAGPSMHKIFDHLGLDLEDCTSSLRLIRQGMNLSVNALSKAPVRSLSCQLVGVDTFTLQGQSIPIMGGALLDLGLTLEEVTRLDRLPLHRHDFTPHMMIEELMLLIEAKSIVVSASQDITLRLEHERNSALDSARRDPLTGLCNRTALEHTKRDAALDLRSLCVMQMDLDHFKAVNDTLGHSAGDHVLRHVAQILRDETHRDDELIRLGGDEFAIILHHIRDPSQAEAVAQRIIERVAHPIPYQDTHCHVSASIGLARPEELGTTTDASALVALLDQADSALYAAKHAGRNHGLWAAAEL